MSFARALGLQDKPHSSITDWVELLTANTIADEAYDGIPELVYSINLQASGPSEASRALRKKIKHGSAHQQYRSLVLLKALVENCGEKFQDSFADDQFTDALRHLASDPYADRKVKKKLILVLLSWHEQFKDDPSMTLAATLYKECRVEKQVSQSSNQPDQRMLEKEESKRKAREEKDQVRREEDERRIKAKQAKGRPKRAPFDFEKEKPKVLATIVDAAQASSNLVNAITLVNTEKERLQDNEKVEECVAKATQMRKILVRYIQLVEKEELIGTLIETNDRINNALEVYEQFLTRDPQASDDTSGISSGLASTHVGHKPRGIKTTGLSKGKEREDDYGSPISPVHPDLQDLDFGSSSLPLPLKPSTTPNGGKDEEDDFDRRGSLSDFSDYESSDDETKASHRRYAKVSDLSDDEHPKGSNRPGGTIGSDDPFADPS